MRVLVGRRMVARCLTVVRLQSVGMCGCVAGVAGAALEAVVVLLLDVTDAVHAVRLAGGEFHALDVHLCVQREKQNTQGYLEYCLKTEQQRGNCLFPPDRGHIY